ncbi:MAG: insulinase family protein [Anaerolineaceae bacterium]|nr:insulinase family protein [Anaerolineaceae bacterium]
MKRYLFLAILAVLAVMVLPVFAAEPTEFGIPEVGTELNGFKVVDVSRWKKYDTAVVKLEHEKTKSVLYWLANDNIDRSYMMAFRTPINDNTGMPHVFEHATLGGNEKYPGANTFFEMSAKTSNTFLNALTGQFYTMYPMASTSEDQLYQYVDYYMNGLTHPLAIENPYAMMREAYRYELDDPEGQINLQGVVYSEMLGALSQSRWASYNYNRMIWPGSYVTTVSGGDPLYIPDLTIEALREFHETYYHPSNATMYLTGDLDLPRFLELLDKDFLSQFDYKELVIDDPNYKPLEPGYYDQTFQYAVETGTPTEKAAIIRYGQPFAISDYNDMEVLDYVCNYMNDESSPLQRMAREKLPEANISMATSWDPDGKVALVFSASSIDEADKETFKTICDDALAVLLKEGVNEEVLNAMLVRNQFDELMSLDSSSVYLDLSQNMATFWAIFGDRDAWKKSADFEANLKDFVTVENLNETARKYWTELDTAVMATTVPAPGLKEENDAALRAKLDEMKAAMSEEEVNALVEQTKAYHQFVEESNAITMPDSLNALSVETLPEEMSYKKASETNIGGVRVVTSEIESPLIRVSIRTDTSAVPFEDLFDFIEYTSLLGRLGTELYTREELPAKMANVSLGMTMYSENSQNRETRELDNYFLASWFALPETLEESFALLEEILYNTDFSDYDFIRSDAAQNYATNQMHMDSNGLAFGVQAVASQYSDLAKLKYYTNTEALMNYWNKLSKYSDAEMDAMVAKFEGFRDMILNKNKVVLTAMGNSENIMRSAVLGYNLICKFSDAVYEPVDYAAAIDALPLHTAIVTGGNVAFNLAAADFTKFGFDLDDGGLRVVEKLVDDKLLYPELRVKNSAYGGYTFVTSDYVTGMYSYRDPKVAETFGVYETTGDFLRNLEISETELAGYITSVYGDLTAPIGPISAAMSGISDQVIGFDSYESTMRKIRDIKAFTPEDIVKYADLYDFIGSKDAPRATAGAKSMIEANAGLYDYINYELMNSDTVSEEAPAEGAAAGSDEELIAAISELTPEDIEAMLANMDENDLQSLVSYVMDYFTDENGNVDQQKVFDLVGSFMNEKWSDAEVSAAVENLDPADGEAAVQDLETVSQWESIFDTFMSGLNGESLESWMENAVTEMYEQDEAAADLFQTGLSNLLQGIFGAYVTGLY